MSETPLLELRGIHKEFSGVPVLKGVSMSVGRGEIVCLLGENGAGKSTLMKIVAGVHTHYEGTMLVDGKPAEFRNTAHAAEYGIGVVYQEFNLCPNLTAMENLFMGHEPRTSIGLIDYRAMRQMAAEAFAKIGARIAPDAIVRALGVAQQQMIEITKAMSHNTRLLIMDEPTAALPEAEVANLFRLVRDLKARGIAIVFISHKLQEVLSLTDRVVCLKDGENSGMIKTSEATEDKLISMMVGRPLDKLYGRRQAEPSSEVVLEVRNLSGPPHIKDVSFEVRRGEIVGLAGLVGAGRTEVAKLIMGAVKRTRGTILLNGRPLKIRDPVDAVAAHIGYVPEDRKRLGLNLEMTVRENSTMTIHRMILGKLGLISPAKERRITDEYIQKLRTKVSTREQLVKNLSGGNQQKVVLAKWLAINPKVLILDEPTRGIDVGAKAEVHKIIDTLADQGVAILVISSELPEVLHLCDRILVMHEGRLTANITRAEATEETVMKAAVA